MISLFEAVKTNDVGLLQALLREGQSVGQHDERHNTPLHLAVLMNNTKAAKALMIAGADAHASNIEGVSPYGIAAVMSEVSDNKAIIKILMGCDAPHSIN